MRNLVLYSIIILFSGCSSTEDPSPFATTEDDISVFQTAYKNRDSNTFPFVLVAVAGPQGSLKIETPDSGNINLLRKYGVVYLVIANDKGRVIHKKLIAGYKNMRGNNAVFFNQIITSRLFNADERNNQREFVVPIALTYPLETY
jgi:hypothetical protein